MKQPIFKHQQLKIFDNLELFSSEKEVSWFPFHFHDYYCVSLLTDGTEQLVTQEQEYFITPGHIGITQYNEVHRNASLGDAGYSYHTLYVNPALLQYFNHNKPVVELQRAIFDPALYAQLQALIISPHLPVRYWESAFRALAAYSVKPTVKRLNTCSIVDELLQEDPAARITTEWLARQCYKSEYHFIHTFKKEKGVTPQSYIMIRRLEAARKALTQGLPVQEIAFRNGFYDSSHFATAFKKYYGVTPAAYRIACI